MTHWIYAANPAFYDVFAAFGEPQVIWSEKSKLAVDDVVYFYLSAPHKQIGYVCRVAEVGLNFDSPDVVAMTTPYMKGGGAEAKAPKKPVSCARLSVDTRLEVGGGAILTLDALREHGLKGMLMGPRKLDNTPELLRFIQDHAGS